MFSFGLGSSCDERLVKDVVVAGRGTSTIVRDGYSDLNGLVIRALSNAMEPSLKDSKVIWNGKEEGAKELYRNSLLYSSCLMSKADFANLSLYFKTTQSDEKKRSTSNLETSFL